MVSEESKKLQKLRMKRYRESHKDILRSNYAEYYKKNRSQLNKNSSSRRKKKKSENLEYRELCNRRSNICHKIKRESDPTYKENVYNKNTKYQKIRRSTDHTFRIITNIRSRIYKALKIQDAKKYIETSELFGASIQDVWEHLESQFKEGMTRENNTPKGWHIDHIKPMSSFDLSDPEQLKECCHYTNLQPLWWWENLSKSDKILQTKESDK